MLPNLIIRQHLYFKIYINKPQSAYAKANKIPFVNYYKAMVDENQALNPQYTKDGVHPTGEGYDIMEPLIKAAIEKAL